MPFRWLEDLTRADLAFEATGRDLGEVFRSSWEAVLDAMVDAAGSPGASVTPGGRWRDIALQAASWEDLLFALLEQVVFLKDAEGLLLLPSSLVLEARDGGVRLAASARALAVEEVLGRLRTDVKAVTLHGYSLVALPEGWRATVVLDV